jgi:hypothetical protein
MPQNSPADEMITDNNWRISKTIPIWGVILTLGQGLFWGIIIYFTLYTSQMNLERRVALLEASSVKAETFVRLDEKMNEVKEDIGSLKKDINDMNGEVRKLSIKGR